VEVAITLDTLGTVLTEWFYFGIIYIRHNVKHPSQRLVSEVVVIEYGEIHLKCRCVRIMMSADNLFIVPSEHVPFSKRSYDLRFRFDGL
jgi:hypothetical protein